jgi:hypothetical protein
LDRKWTNIRIWPRDRASISVQQLHLVSVLTYGVQLPRIKKAQLTACLCDLPDRKD